MKKNLNIAYIKGIATLGIAKVLNQSAPIIITVIFSKILSISKLGELSFVIAIITLLSVMTDFGLSETIQKFLSEDKDLLSPLVLWEIISTIFIGILLFIIDSKTRFLGGNGFGLMIVIIGSSFNIIIMAFNGLLRVVEAGAYQIISTLLFIMGVIFLYTSHYSAIESVIWSRSFSWLIISFIMLIILIKEGLLRFRLKLSKKVVFFALNTFWLGLVELLIGQLDVVYIRAILGDNSVGIYKPAYLLGIMPSVIGVLLGAPLLPIFVNKIKVNTKTEIRKFLFLLTGILAFIMLIGSSLALIFGKEILRVFYTEEISNKGFTIFMLIFITESIFVITLPVLNYFLAKGESSFIRNVATLKFFLFIILVATYTASIGINWVGLVFVLVYTLVLIIYWTKYFVESR